MFLGIDLGTSGIKVIVLDSHQTLVAQSHQTLEVSRPRPLFSEQNPHDWWQALTLAMQSLAQAHPDLLQQIKAIGLSGQMHGAVLLDGRGKVIRPAILWNDGRSFDECQWLEQQVSGLRDITGNVAMPGFTAPKLRWVKQHEPELFARTSKILLPKDYLRFCMTGDYASDMSDSAGTLWLDVDKRAWSTDILNACDLNLTHMPTLYEGSEITGVVTADIANSWGIPVNTPVVAGGGDNAAGAVGSSVVDDGQALLSIGTSGVIFTSSMQYKANPARGVHSFCHAIPNRWHQMSVILSAASCLDWGAKLIGSPSVSHFMALAEQCEHPNKAPVFLPYLSGERTPHNNPSAQGVIFGLTHDTAPADIARAIIDGVAFAFADGYIALTEAGVKCAEMALIGGGAKSAFLSQILADVLNLPMLKFVGGEVGPAFGAARLAMLSQPEFTQAQVCQPNTLAARFDPNPEHQEKLTARLQKYRDLYPLLKSTFN